EDPHVRGIPDARRHAPPVGRQRGLGVDTVRGDLTQLLAAAIEPGEARLERPRAPGLVGEHAAPGTHHRVEHVRIDAYVGARTRATARSSPRSASKGWATTAPSRTKRRWPAE